jgi:hypothetical protein
VHRILAAVCEGDLEPIKRLVLNRDADEFSRGVAVAALALLAVWAEVPRHTMVDYFAWLAREGLEREPSYVWSALASESADMEALVVFPELRRAYDDGLIDPRTIGRSELDEVEASPRGDLFAGFNGPLTVKCRTVGATADETMINARANRTFLEQV